jgi:hypothetical protein
VFNYVVNLCFVFFCSSGTEASAGVTEAMLQDVAEKAAEKAADKAARRVLQETIPEESYEIKPSDECESMVCFVFE